ncbi:hypothetical protein AB0M46_00235 [Dactylosporangium sp. NPDC051485]|uniref:hypothetical protein n=1 Tax=Dactylosporangium sp. NPDC051485 TaxID=3154846 RepID=UPI003434390D
MIPPPVHAGRWPLDAAGTFGGTRIPAGRRTELLCDPRDSHLLVVVSGVVSVALFQPGGPDYRSCRSGDIMSIPPGCGYSVAADGLDGSTILDVRAPAEQGRPAAVVDHFEVPLSAQQRRVALHRATEAAWPLGDVVRMAQDFHAFDATLYADPSHYRVTRIGPFECVIAVEPVERVVGLDVLDVVAEVMARHGLPVFLEGSQSPLSVKQPCASSDVDLLVAIDDAAQIGVAHRAVADLEALRQLGAVRISTGIVLRPWLRLPNFYSALSVDAAGPDRRWWRASPAERLAEAHRRVSRGLAVIADPDRIGAIQDQTIALMRSTTRGEVREMRLVPRWVGLQRIVLPAGIGTEAA